MSWSEPTDAAIVSWSRRFRHARIQPTVKLVGLIIGFRSSDEGTRVDDLGTVADQCALSLATVHAAVDQLTAEGWLELEVATSALRLRLPEHREGAA